MRDVILDEMIERMIASNQFARLQGPDARPPRRWLERWRDYQTKQTLTRIKKSQHAAAPRMARLTVEQVSV